ncbi:hypothetical protein EYF80_046828 [Liparis tanakae]|uniref:Uncharacterized protein n=1 Tax=Liparis tanakae TaxID=230148 RepID=A0A4Z2FQI2_9TELE|nr:hypothetical protein EYF80_046828 [Liparis tanakae]
MYEGAATSKLSKDLAACLLAFQRSLSAVDVLRGRLRKGPEGNWRGFLVSGARDIHDNLSLIMRPSYKWLCRKRQSDGGSVTEGLGRRLAASCRRLCGRSVSREDVFYLWEVSEPPSPEQQHLPGTEEHGEGIDGTENTVVMLNADLADFADLADLADLADFARCLSRTHRAALKASANHTTPHRHRRAVRMKTYAPPRCRWWLRPPPTREASPGCIITTNNEAPDEAAASGEI